MKENPMAYVKILDLQNDVEANLLGAILAAATGWLGGRPRRHPNRTGGVRTELSLSRLPAAIQG